MHSKSNRPKKPIKSPEHKPVPDREASGWNHVASWYDKLIEEKRSVHHDELILPRIKTLLNPKRGQHILDIACGQGALLRELSIHGIEGVGVDASKLLIDAAIQRASPHLQFLVADARQKNLMTLLSKHSPFDVACCVLAMMNMDPVDQIFKNVYALLKPGGHFVIIILHPAFRSPGLTDWEWISQNVNPRAVNEKGNPKATRADKLYRRVSGYLSPLTREIIMNPGKASKGENAIKTLTYHRPVQFYIRAFVQNGFLINFFEEWDSPRQSTSGPRATEENRMRQEIPMFLALGGKKP